jgi:hypothetical protein
MAGMAVEEVGWRRKRNEKAERRTQIGCDYGTVEMQHDLSNLMDIRLSVLVLLVLQKVLQHGNDVQLVGNLQKPSLSTWRRGVLLNRRNAFRA